MTNRVTQRSDFTGRQDAHLPDAERATGWAKKAAEACSIARFDLPCKDGHTAQREHCTVSFGVTWLPGGGKTLDELKACANLCLRRSKDAGAGRVTTQAMLHGPGQSA